MARTKRPLLSELAVVDSPRGRLAAAIAAAYPKSTTRFFKQVAEKTQRSFQTEKGALYRYLRGGTLPVDRLAVYAEVLNADADLWQDVIVSSPRADETVLALTAIAENQKAVVESLGSVAVAARKAARMATENRQRLVRVEEVVNELRTLAQANDSNGQGQRRAG